MDGVSPTITVTDITDAHIVEITDASGTNDFYVYDGIDGQPGVYVGDTQPTNPLTQVWIDTSGE